MLQSTSERKGINRKEHKEVVLAQRGDDGAFVEFKANGDRLPFEPCAQGVHPFIKDCWRVREDAELACLRISCLHTDIVFGISPVDADEARKLLRR
jgi:hypothetical protein